MANVLDSIIGYVSPEKALKREHARYRLDAIRNSGYSDYGASRSKKSLKGWTASGGSAVEDIHDNLQTLRVRSRDLVMGVPLASGAIKAYRTNVVGSGLVPKPIIDAKALGITDDRASEVGQKIAREFYLWAETVDCDGERMENFYGLQQIAFMNWLMSGDVFALLQNKNRINNPYSLCIQLVEADRVSTPDMEYGFEPNTKILGGVEVDDSGEVVAYHISNHHPLSFRTEERKWTRVEAFGKNTGRRNVLHVMSRERIGQRRGVPMLAPVIESLKQIGRYTDAELVAAVVNGYMTVFIESAEDNALPPLGQLPDETGAEAPIDKNDRNAIELGPGAIIDLAPGEKANAVNPGRPNTSFDGFVTAIAKQIGAALELPYELLMKQFTASYSASRAALLEAWKSFKMWREWMTEKFCQPIYEEWLAEAVARGRVDAPGFFTDPAIRKAYCAAEWYGPTQGQLDPVKEVTAASLRVTNGFSTRAKEAMELTGTDFLDNMKAAKVESELMKESGVKEYESKAKRNSNEQQ